MKGAQRAASTHINTSRVGIHVAMDETYPATMRIMIAKTRAGKENRKSCPEIPTMFEIVLGSITVMFRIIVS